MTTHGEADSSTPRYRHVLVPLDGSELALAALPTARRLAQGFKADLRTVSVASSPSDVEDLRSHAAQAIGVDVQDDRVGVVTGDDPAAAIQRRAAELDPCLVCMSTHGRGRVAGAIIGSIARSLLQAAHEPVVAVGPAVNRPRSFASTPAVQLWVPRVVACVDGGAPSERVLPVAAGWAWALGMSLTILTVAEPIPPPLRTEASWHRHHGPDCDADEYVHRLGEAWKEAAPEVDTHVVYDPLGAAQGIESYLEDYPAGIVAVTTHARSGVQRLLLGSGAATIVHRSSAPVLVVPIT